MYTYYKSYNIIKLLKTFNVCMYICKPTYMYTCIIRPYTRYIYIDRMLQDRAI